jgi:hypothetical protein
MAGSCWIPPKSWQQDLANIWRRGGHPTAAIELLVMFDHMNGAAAPLSRNWHHDPVTAVAYSGD